MSSRFKYPLFTNSVEHDGVQQRQPSVADAPTDNSPSVAFCPNFKWERLTNTSVRYALMKRTFNHLSWIDPRNRQPRCTEDSCVQEDKESCGATILSCFSRVVYQQARKGSCKDLSKG